MGKPMLFRLEVENIGDRIVQFDAGQVHVNASMSVEGSDGVAAPYVAGMAQTGGGPHPLRPGERRILFDALDIEKQYLLTSAGTYTVRFRGQDEGFGDTAIPASNPITIRVADGAVRPSRSIGRMFVDASQSSGWRVEYVRDVDAGTALALSRGKRAKLGTPWVRVWVVSPSETPSPDAEEAPQPLGHSAWGEVYWSLRNATADEESAARKLVVTTLGIEER
ncbi:MAG TPA: hypothetical protein VJ826_03925 [Candidatus Polarisedimenticolaceae bacterium]|nr:hypothetical protein [Candidatus Polarisedimenticolaceae bacterium]